VIGDRNVTVSSTPAWVSTNSDFVAVTVSESCRRVGNGKAVGDAGDPRNRYGVPSMVARPVIAVMRPVQKLGQVPGRLSAASQVLRYGERTTRGTAGGRTAGSTEDSP
jgi:hypothetical protein